MNNSTTLDEQLKAMGEACIDNTPQQVESLAKELESRANDIHVSLVISASDSSEVRAKKFFDAVDDAIKEKKERELTKKVKRALIEIDGVIDETANIDITTSFAISKAVEAMIQVGYRKGE